ncbi:MAG: hypothetical protein ACLQGU_08250 [bacterium]
MTENVANIGSERLCLPKTSFRTVALVSTLNNLFRKFIDFRDPRLYTLSVIFAILTYLYDIFDQIPYLQVFGQWGSGKTLFGDILHGVCSNSFISSEISDAALYRVIEIGQKKGGITMIIDEADEVSGSIRRGILLRVLRSGFRKNGNVIRCGPYGTIERFSTYSPKIILTETGIEDSALDSRTVPIYMVKSESPLKEFRSSEVEKDFKTIREEIRSFCGDYRDLVTDRYLSYERIDGVSGRDREVWTPIIIIAGLLAALLDAPFVKKDMVTLARNTIRDRKRKRLIGNRDLQILVSTREFLREEKSVSNGLFVAENLRDFIRLSWNISGLTTEAVGRTLNRNGVIKELKRPRLEISEGGLTKTVQKTCYVFDQEILSRLTIEFF